MKSKVYGFLIGVIIAGGTAYGVTKIAINQIKGLSTPNGAVAISVPNTTNSVWANLGPNCTINAGVFNCSSVGPTIPSFAAEIPSGLINGTNVTFTLANAPTTNPQFQNAIWLYWNGLALFQGAGDFVLSGPTITLTNAPQTGDTLIVVYMH